MLRKVKKITLEKLDNINSLRVNTNNTVVVNGFWRSGTTWLQEVVASTINAKRVFEPFQARSGYIQMAYKGISLPASNYSFLNGLMPFAKSGDLTNKNLISIIDKAQKGILNNYFVLRDQKLLDLSRCFCSNVVVKYVKGALCLRYIYDRYHSPIIHIYRDPRAVISSIKSRKGWGEGAFDSLNLFGHLLGVDDGRYEYFSQWHDEILRIDQTDDIQKLATYYFLTEKFVEHSFTDIPDSISFIPFDDMKRHPEKSHRAILKYLGIDEVRNNIDFRKPSSTAYTRNESEQGINYHGSDFQLTSRQIESIERLASIFDMESRLIKNFER